MQTSKKRLLLHSCCAPCCSAVTERLYGEFDVTLFCYNPNIIPAAEYEKRLSEQRRLASILGVGLITGDYETDAFSEATKGLERGNEGGERCERCMALRLQKTAALAEEKGFGLFTTTLSVSPHKNAATINKLLKENGEKYKITPLLEDFKKKDGYKRSIELSRRYGLYRQNYCGCAPRTAKE